MASTSTHQNLCDIFLRRHHCLRLLPLHNQFLLLLSLLLLLLLLLWLDNSSLNLQLAHRNFSGILCGGKKSWLANRVTDMDAGVRQASKVGQE